MWGFRVECTPCTGTRRAVWVLGFRVLGSGFWVQDSELDIGFGVSGNTPPAAATAELAETELADSAELTDTELTDTAGLFAAGFAVAAAGAES